jgi:cell division protein FtsZ
MTDGMVFELEELPAQSARMKVVGVGGGGGNAVNRMIEEQLTGVQFISVNTDAQALGNSRSDIKVQIGKKLTRGLGAGARPEIGRQAIEENRDEVLEHLQGADLVFVTCGMGGGTGTGAAPIIAQIAKDIGALTVGIVTKPFLFEGRKRMKQAEMGITELRRNVDTMIVVPNERLLAVVGKGIPFQDALKKADEVLLNATRGIASLITSAGIINVDFADVRTVMQNGGAALMGTGIGRGENRALEAAQQAISSPLLDNVSINGASGVLINILGGADLTLGEATQISEIIHDAVGDDAQIIFGAGGDPNLTGEVRVTVIATGFDRAVTGEPVVDRGTSGQVLPFRKGPTAGMASSGGGGAPPPPAGNPSATGQPGQASPQQPYIRPAAQAPTRPAASPDVSDMEIPTFIRRQMD